MKLIKIRFTSWRDQSPEPRSPAVQQLLDAWTTRINLLAVAAERTKEEQAHADSDALQESLASIIADLQQIEDERTLLLSAEKVMADAAARAARENKKIGTFGYQVLNDSGTHGRGRQPSARKGRVFLRSRGRRRSAAVRVGEET